MKKCIKCQNILNNGAITCHHCGSVQPKRDRSPLIIIILIIVAIFIFMAITLLMSSKNREYELETKQEDTEINNSSTNNDENHYVEEEVIEEEKEEIYNGYDISMFTEIDINQFNNILLKKDNQKYFVLTASQYCSHCVSFLPKVNKSLQEYNYEVYYLNMMRVSKDEITDIQNRSPKFSYFGSTPIVFLIENGEVIDLSIGNLEYEKYSSFLEKNGISKK